MAEEQREEGSFRDNAGQVFYHENRVLRTVSEAGRRDFEYVRSTGLIDDLVSQDLIVTESVVDPQTLNDVEAIAGDAAYVLEHPKIPFISYPYEWTFSALKSAALLHLKIQLLALQKGVSLSDASAYNVQFRGSQPIFIDSLSFRRYEEGEFWGGHRQFCEQFVNPLLLGSQLGLAHNAWYRGNLEGIGAEELAKVLPWHSRFSWHILTNVFLHARLQKSSQSTRKAANTARTKGLSRMAFQQMLDGMQRWISRLERKKDSASVWEDYADNNSYDNSEARQKRDFVQAFASAVKPGLMFDIGCNTGEYSAAALESGATRAIGFDFDYGALEYGYANASSKSLDFLPLHMDAANQSPPQGWRGAERKGLSERARGSAVIALAVVHHLAIARNLPLREVLNWIVDMAPEGVVEFVPKSDAMVKQLLSLREDIFEDYSEGRFRDYLTQRCRIVKEETVSSSGRILFWYSRQ